MPVPLLDILQWAYSLRVRCGVNRQPTHKINLQKLCAFLQVDLKSIPPAPPHPNHPYELSPEQFKLLADSLVQYQHQCAGAPADISDVEYLYRLASPRDLTNSTGWNIEAEKVDSIAAWQRLKILCDNKQDWLQLEDYSRGEYAGLFQLSWWTDLDPTSDIFAAAHKMGMFTDWVPPLLFLLRCRVTDVEHNLKAYVPTVLDAFPQSVYHPMDEKTGPTYGLTIDLSDWQNLTTGVKEFVLAPIEVRHIDVLPIELTPQQREPHLGIGYANLEIWKSLIIYYSVL